MLTFKVLDTLKHSDAVLRMITNTKPSNIKISNGQTLLIKRTNIKSVEPIIYELTYRNKVIVLWEYPINELEEENSSLRQTARYFKDKFNKLMKLLKEKLFGWGKKDSIYKQVVNDLYDKDILDDGDIKDIKKDDYEL